MFLSRQILFLRHFYWQINFWSFKSNQFLHEFLKLSKKKTNRRFDECFSNFKPMFPFISIFSVLLHLYKYATHARKCFKSMGSSILKIGYKEAEFKLGNRTSYRPWYDVVYIQGSSMVEAFLGPCQTSMIEYL